MKNKKFPKSLLIALAGFGVWTGELYKYVFCRDTGLFKLLPSRKTHDADYYAHRDAEARRLRDDPRCIKLSIVNAEGKTLHGFYYPCGDEPGKKLAFIIHGYRSEHAETAGMFADYYHSRGVDLFCCDHAGHGESEGEFIGWSLTESRDCLKWLDYLTAMLGGDAEIILHGFSMGGATVLAMSDACPKQVKFIVSDSGFSGAADLLKTTLGPMLPTMRLLNCVVGGYDIRDTDVRPHLMRTDKPILFVHGRADPTVPFRMGEELYGLCPTEKDCLFTDDAKHIETMHRHPAEYEEKLDAFMGRYLEHNTQNLTLETV